MPKAYWISAYRQIYNPDALAAYAKLAGPAITAAGGRFLARGIGPQHGGQRGMQVVVPALRHQGQHQLARVLGQGGADAADPTRLQALTDALAPARAPADDSVKAQLKQHSDDAIAARVFGVPSFEVDGRVFWGVDALPMLRAYLDGDAWFASGAWEAAAQVGPGLVRAR